MAADRDHLLRHRGMTSDSTPLSSASLRARAIAALARREHSRKELERKLAPLAESAEQLKGVLDALQRERLQSDLRFAESVARVRGTRFGAARIRMELQQKGVAEEDMAGVIDELRATQADHLRLAWEKKFGSPPADINEAARQQRFLLQRGFPAELVSRFLRSLRNG